MLDSLHIKNYRAFRELKIDRLGRVNLFIGKNSTGKSSLLEAINIYCNNANETTLYNILVGRNEDWRLATLAPNQQDTPLRYLFHGYSSLEGRSMELSIGSVPSTKSDESAVTIRAVELIVGQGNDRPHYSKVEASGPGQRANTIGGFEICSGNDKLYIPAYRKGNADFIIHAAQSGKMKCSLLTTSNLDDFLAVELLDTILYQELDLEKELLRCLQLIEPRITGIFHLAGGYAWTRQEGKPVEGRIPFVRLKNLKQPVPLKNLGDGITRLLLLIGLMLNSKDGVLLVDEFENGLHWAVQAKIWRYVFEFAKKLNIQIFATTHSLDCVKAFHKAWAENEMEDGACYRLQRDEEGEIIPFELPRELLEAAIETSVEMR